MTPRCKAKSCVPIAISCAVVSLGLSSCGSPGSSPAAVSLPPAAEPAPSGHYESPVPEAEVVVEQVDFDYVIENAVGDRVTLTDLPRTTPEEEWWVTSWNGSSVDRPEIYCLGLPNGITCRADGEAMEYPVKQLLFDDRGTVLLVDVGISSVTATLDGDHEVRLEARTVGLPSGRRLVVIPFPAVPGSIEVSALNETGEVAALTLDTSGPPVRAGTGQLLLRDMPQAPKELLAEATPATSAPTD